MVRQGWVGKGKLGAIAGNLALLFSSFLLAMPRVAANDLATFPVRQENLINRNIEADLQQATASFLEEREDAIASLVVESTEETGEETPSETVEPETQVFVSEVVVEGEGLTPELEELIYENITIEAGKTTTRSQQQQDAAAIVNTGFFANVTYSLEDTSSGVRAIFRVKAYPILTQVVIKTLPQDVSTSILPQQIIDDIFSARYGKILNSQTLQEDKTKIGEWYQENGYDLAQVVESSNVTDNGVLTLFISEGIIEAIRVRYYFWQEENEEFIEADKSTHIPVSMILDGEMKLKSGTTFNREIAQTELKRIFENSNLL